MEWLVLIHVLSAIIGVGPTFFGHVLLRRNQSAEELRQSLRVAAKLEYFPKIGGSIAVLTGILLVVIGNYGSFLQLWLIGSLILYILIQFFAISAATSAKKLASSLTETSGKEGAAFQPEQQQWYMRANRFYWLASSMGVLLFIFMIMQPVI